MQALVVATADAAEVVLGEIDQIIDAATEGSGPEGGAGNGSVGGGNGQEPDSRDGASLDDDAIPEIIEDTTTLPRVRAGIVLDDRMDPPRA